MKTNQIPENWFPQGGGTAKATVNGRVAEAIASLRRLQDQAEPNRSTPKPNTANNSYT